MKKTEVRDLLYQELGSLLVGYKLRKKDEGFVRTIPGGVQKILVPLWDYNPAFPFSLALCTRLDGVEQLFHLFSTTPPKYQAESLTSVTQLAYFFNSPQKREYKITSERDIAEAMKELAPLLRDRILPFMDQHRTLQALDASMNALADPQFDISHRSGRSMHALILAYLNHNPNLETLAAAYQQEISAWVAPEREKLSKLIEYLWAHPLKT